MKNFGVVVLLFIASFAVAQTTTQPITVKEYKLKNGLTVMLTENHNEPQVFGMVAVKAGGKNDPADATGIAHYLEHMLFKGTEEMGTIDYKQEKVFLDEINTLYEKLGQTTDEEERKKIQKKINEASVKAGDFAIANEIDKMLMQIGSKGVNAFTTEDYTAYHNSFPPNQIEKWLEIYSHRFENPVFRLFQSELETVYEEKNMSMDSDFGQLFEEINKSVYKKHPYGQQTILGSVEHLKNPSLLKMYEFYNTYYVANNMVLALSGDFDIATIMPMIEAKFGGWRTGVVPEFPNYEEAPFNGREFAEKKLTPIKVGALNYRTPPAGSPDVLPLELAVQILSNAEMTGLLDKITDEGKIMAAGAMPITYNDYGSTLIYFIPKLVGQKLEEAEALVKEQIKKLNAGDFSDNYFNAIKLNKRKEIDLFWEDNFNRVYEMVQAFTENKGWAEYYARYTAINSITKQSVVDVANKYFTDNYFCFYSKMGFPKKEKLEKPGFEPIIPNSEKKSEFRLRVDKMKTITPTPRYVDFEADIQSEEVEYRFTLNQVKNPFNKVFDLEIKYGVGKYKMPVLQQTETYLGLLGTEDKTVSELKEAFSELGASYSFVASEESFSMYIEGFEDNLEAILALVQEFNTKLKLDESKVKQMLDDRDANLKMERNNTGFIVNALNQYVLYGDEAKQRRELTKKELKSLTGQVLIDAYQTARGFETTVNYVGNINIDSVVVLCRTYLATGKDLQPKQPLVVLDRKTTASTKIYVINNKKAVQSKMIFNIEGAPRDNEKVPLINAFNAYFGDGMSSLVFQEIREFRSLAYSAYGKYRMAPKEGKDNHFIGYIACQADKTNDAMNAMMNLINDMPEKPERIDMIRSAIEEESMSARPNFRYLIDEVETWKEEGYLTDPNALYIDRYAYIDFGEILDFYRDNLQNKPQIIVIVGDVKRFDLKKLAEYGEVIKVKDKELYVN